MSTAARFNVGLDANLSVIVYVYLHKLLWMNKSGYWTNVFIIIIFFF